MLGLAAVAAVAAVVLLSRDDPPARAGARWPRCEPSTGSRPSSPSRSTGPDTSVRCNGAVREALVTRCQVVYDNGDTQLLLVTLSDAGELETQVPYPARRRPGG